LKAHFSEKPSGTVCEKLDAGPDDTPAELLRQLVAEQRQTNTTLDLIRQALERQQHSPLSRADRVRLARVLPAVAGAIGSELFLTHELFESDSAALRVALRGLNTRKVGRLLGRAEGTPIGGLVVERVTSEAGAIVWRVAEFLGNGKVSVTHALREIAEE
jgi:hypothetical protein